MLLYSSLMVMGFSVCLMEELLSFESEMRLLLFPDVLGVGWGLCVVSHAKHRHLVRISESVLLKWLSSNTLATDS